MQPERKMEEPVETVTKYAKLSELDLSKYPDTLRLCERMIELWPDHEARLATSLGNRSVGVMEDTEATAGMVIKMGEHRYGGIDQFCHDYRYFCQELVLPMELHFHRYGEYKCATFEDAYNEVYSKQEVMERYMNGLIISNVFWSNHAASMNFYKAEYIPMLPENFTHLEIGPGHGGLLDIAVSNPNCGKAIGWDISPVSIESTRIALEIIGIEDQVELVLQDMFKAPPQGEYFDSIVMSELLEHLEDPLAALKSVMRSLKPGGYIYINMPANSPAPDHLYLIDNITELTDMMKEAGYEIAKAKEVPVSGYTLEQCRKNRTTVTCLAIGRKPL